MLCRRVCLVKFDKLFKYIKGFPYIISRGDIFGQKGNFSAGIGVSIRLFFKKQGGANVPD